MNLRRSFLLFVLAGCSASGAREPRAIQTRAAAPSSGLSPVATTALASREAARFARSLADEVGPRLAGSPGDAAAVQWAERTMRALELANVRTEPVIVPVWRRGEERAKIVADGRALDVNAFGWSGSTPAEGVEAEVARFTALDDLAKSPEGSLKGKIVFLDVPMERSTDGSGYGRAVSGRYRTQTLGAAKGAIAAVIRSVGTDTDNPHTGSTNRGETPGIPIGALSNASADVLAQKIASGPTRLRLVLASQRLPDERSANVVGEILGREKPDEVILLGAHLDSWDTGRGAVDDGAGCGAVLDAIRLLAAARPARTIRVVLFAAEENSRAGGTQYAKQHASEAEKIVLTMEVDGGTDRVESLGFVGDPEKAATLRTIAEPLAALGVRFVEGRKTHPGADVTPLVERGVPSIDVRQNVSRYFDIHHTRGDTSDKLDAEALAQVTAVVAHLAHRAAEPAIAFGRVPPALRKED